MNHIEKQQSNNLKNCVEHFECELDSHLATLINVIIFNLSSHTITVYYWTWESPNPGHE